MIYSMTGVGKAIVQHEGKQITIFVKTLNGKQLDLTSRLPALYREREVELRNMVAEALGRGKIELSVSVDDKVAQTGDLQRINPLALQHYLGELKRLTSLGQGTEEQNLLKGVDISLEALLRLPGVMLSGDSLGQAELSEGEWRAVRSAMETALADVVAFRRQEGTMLERVCRERIANIRSLLGQVDEPEGQRVQTIRQRLQEALEKLSPEGIDRGRLEQELIFYIEKLDINEEKDRLRHHLDYFIEVMEEEAGGQGKRLGFIAQEIGREINTLGSKSNNAEMQRLVVSMKDELEQIKEQSLNIL